ncbi:MAG: hypothetical protein ACKO7W_09065 [Elainella sp.]
MNKVSGAALVAVGLLAGVGLTAIGSRVSQVAPQNGQVTPQAVASPVAALPQRVDRLETDRAIFHNVAIVRYAGEPPTGVDVAGELYQVTASITNRSDKLLIPAFTYNLRDGQGRKFEKAAWTIGLGDDGIKTGNGILSGQTRDGIIIGVFDVLPGATGLELGVTDGMFATTKYVSPPQQAAAQPLAQPPATTLVSAPASAPAAAVQPTAAAPAFEILPPCDQLDAVAKSGKSVADFVKADWAKYGGAGSICAWHQPQIDVAYRLLNPPAPVRATARRSSSSGGGNSSGGSSGGTVVIQQAPQGFNNCNGRRDPGESYSAACESWQRQQPRPRPEPPAPRPEPPASSGEASPIPFNPGYGGQQ